MANIPVIDISPSNPEAAKQLLTAAEGNGFLFVEANAATGITAGEIDDMFALSKAFFAAPTETKNQCAINTSESGKNRGWLGMHTERLDPGVQKRGDFKEAFNFSSNAPPQPLSGPLGAKREQLLAFQRKCHALCLKILGLFGEALQTTPPGWFVERHDASVGSTGSILRLLYYPRVEGEVHGDEGDIRAGAHSDYGSVTLLFQRRGQPGLEILSGGGWEGVDVDPNGDTKEGEALPIVVNFGDLLAYWTNGLLKSTVHRVVFPQGEQNDRYSMVYFCHPLDDAELEPVPSRLVEKMGGGEEARREVDKVKGLSGNGVVTARQHLEARLGVTYQLKA